MAELDPGVRDLLEAIRELLGAPMPDTEGNQATELGHRVSLVVHALDRVLCEDPKAMADFLRDPPQRRSGR
jgi:hypothetical protein